MPRQRLQEEDDKKKKDKYIHQLTMTEYCCVVSEKGKITYMQENAHKRDTW
jgi:hypothetical protein